MNKTLFTSLVFLFTLTAHAQDWKGITYKYYDIYPGYIISSAGDTTKGYVEHGNRASNQKSVTFYTDASKKERKKYKPDEILGYGVADKDYRTVAFSGGLMSKPLSFVLVAKPGRVTQFIYYSKKGETLVNVRGPNESEAQFDERIHADEIVWQKLNEKPLQQQELVLGYAKKVSKLLADHPELAAKVESKEKGYGLMNIYDVMAEYNSWWMNKK